MFIGFATFGLHFDGDSLNRGSLGGSETAVICLAREFAKRGNEVHVYCLTDRPGEYDGVIYHPLEGLICKPSFDVFVCSRFPQLLHDEVNAKLKLLWCHDMPTDRDALMGAMWQIDKVITLSKFQTDEYLKQVPELAPLIWQSSNGVDMELVKANIMPKVQGKLIYTSRPERGLLYLLRDIFPKMLAERPGLRLHVCTYDLPNMRIAPEVKAIHAECDKLIHGLGDHVVKMGALTKARLYQEMSSAELWLYPTDFPEISCIGAMEAQACGTCVVSTYGFALAETAQSFGAVLIEEPHGTKEYARRFVDVAFGSVGWEDNLATTSPQWIEESGFTWPAVADKWLAMMQAEISPRQIEISESKPLTPRDIEKYAGQVNSGTFNPNPLLIVFANNSIAFDGDTIEREGLGGSETALICLACEFAKMGNSVHVFNNCNDPGVYNGVTYSRFEDLETFNRGQIDVFICAQCEPILIRKSIGARLTIYWAQGMFWQLPPHNAQGMMWQCDKIATLSEFQRESFRKGMPGCTPLLFDAPNGVDMSLVEANLRPKVSGKLIYTSRPERGLVRLLRDIFPKLLEHRPGLTLHLCTYEYSASLPEEVIRVWRECDGLAAKLGDRVVRLGSLNKAQLYQEISSSEAMVYPCDFEEAGCIAVLEAQACGTFVVTTRDYALCETGGSVLCALIGRDEDYNQNFIAKTLNILDAGFGHGHEHLSNGPRWVKEKGWAWPQIAKKWAAIFREEFAKQIIIDDGGSGDVPRRPTVAACLIVKNEEANLHRCLSLLQGKVDEIHIVDTGSTDRTAEIAKRFTRHVKHVAFDNFAQSRNESIKGITTDWILWLDADEELMGAENIRKYLSTRFFNGYVIRQTHLMLDGERSSDTPIRLFRNKPEYRFTGLIHEHAEDISEKPFDQQIAPAMFLPDVEIAHRGYTNEQVRKEKVSNRNMALLRRSLMEEPGRLMTWLMAERDCLTIARWESQQKLRIDCGSRFHELLCAGVEIHLRKFGDDAESLYYKMSYPIYQDILKLMSQFALACHGRNSPPFEVAMGFLGSAYPGGIADRKTLEGKSFWFPDVESFKASVTARMNKLPEAIALPKYPQTVDINVEHLNQTVADLLDLGIGVIEQKYTQHSPRPNKATVAPGESSQLPALSI